MKHFLQAAIYEDELYGGKVIPIRKKTKKEADDLFDKNKNKKKKRDYSEERKVKRGEENE